MSIWFPILIDEIQIPAANLEFVSFYKLHISEPQSIEKRVQTQMTSSGQFESINLNVEANSLITSLRIILRINGESVETIEIPPLTPFGGQEGQLIFLMTTKFVKGDLINWKIESDSDVGGIGILTGLIQVKPI